MTFNRRILTSTALVVLLGLISACGESKTEEQRLADATTAFNSGEYREALIELKNLLQDNPNSKQARVLLAETSLNIGDADAAAKELERAKGLGATTDEIYALQQRSWLKLGKYQELVDNYAPGKSDNENDRSEMQAVYAKGLRGLDRTDEARQQFQRLVDSGSNASWKAEGLVGLASIARSNGDEERALELAKQAISVDANSAMAYITLGQINVASANFEEAYDYFVAGLQAAELNDEQRFVMISGELEAALGKGDVEASKEAGNRLFTLAPKHPITSYLLARVAYVSGDKELAFEKIQLVLSEFPSFLPAQFLQGALSLERKNYPQAEMFLSNIVAAQPANFEARRMLAEATLQLGNTSEAADILKTGLAVTPGQPELSSMLARVNLRLDNSVENTELLEKALEANGDDDATRIALISAYVAGGRAADAQALMESTDSDVMTPERKAIIKLIAAMQAGDNAEIISQADSMIAAWPDNALTHNMIGRWYLAEGMVERARTTLENSYKINPDSVELLVTLSQTDISGGSVSDAVARYEEFLERNPQSQNAWLSLVSLHSSNSSDDKIAETLQRARKALPSAYMPDVVWTRYLLSKNRLTEATEVAEKLANNYENVAIAQFIYGRVLFENSQFDRALDLLKKANSLSAGKPETLAYKARTEARLQRLAQAKMSYQALWDANPGNLEAAQSIALLEQRKGNTSGAREILAELREIRPDDPRVDIIDADLKAERGLNKAAYDQYERVYALRPSRDLSLKLARLADLTGSDAEVILRRWLEYAPDDSAARMVLAQRLQQDGRSNDAIAEYETIVAEKADDSLVLNNLAWLHFESGERDSLDRALDLSKRAYEMSTNNAQIADTYGWILFKAGQVEKGVEVLALADANAREQGLSDAKDITYHYAAALSESGDRTGARIQLQGILNDGLPFYSREDAQRLLDSLAR
ncbi:MAG: XrtA/PEP-CTERM system TPR-repeat protein PrsT [Gammaproteobacteria bacterium]